MKKLIISSVFAILSTGAYTQSGNPISVTEDKELSKYVFNHINNYRSTLPEKPFIWTEFWYSSAKRWNNEVSKNGNWGHNRGKEWEDFLPVYDMSLKKNMRFHVQNFLTD